MHKNQLHSMGDEYNSNTHFFSDPSFSLRDVYWPLRVLYICIVDGKSLRVRIYRLKDGGNGMVLTMNHRRTRTDRSSSDPASAMAANSSGRSHQYAIHTRQSSVQLSNIVQRMIDALPSKGREESVEMGGREDVCVCVCVKIRLTRELGERDGREDEGRGGQRGEVTRKGGDANPGHTGRIPAICSSG